MNVLLSIKPEFAEKILTGEKRYEFRKSPFRKADAGDQVVMYASAPVQKLVGVFFIREKTEGSPEELWGRFRQKSGFDDPQRFFNYFEDFEYGYALEARDVTRFTPPIDPTDEINKFRPPVSFEYINDHCYNTLIGESNGNSIEIPKSACD